MAEKTTSKSSTSFNPNDMSYLLEEMRKLLRTEMTAFSQDLRKDVNSALSLLSTAQREISKNHDSIKEIRQEIQELKNQKFNSTNSGPAEPKAQDELQQAHIHAKLNGLTRRIMLRNSKDERISEEAIRVMLECLPCLEDVEFFMNNGQAVLVFTDESKQETSIPRIKRYLREEQIDNIRVVAWLTTLERKNKNYIYDTLKGYQNVQLADWANKIAVYGNHDRAGTATYRKVIQLSTHHEQVKRQVSDVLAELNLDPADRMTEVKPRRKRSPTVQSMKSTGGNKPLNPKKKATKSSTRRFESDTESDEERLVDLASKEKKGMRTFNSLMSNLGEASAGPRGRTGKEQTGNQDLPGKTMK